MLARPVTYLTWLVSSDDGAAHNVQIYASVSSLLAVNSPDQKVEWDAQTAGPLTTLRVGTAAQTLLAPAGDDTRIDWGYAYAAAPTDGLDRCGRRQSGLNKRVYREWQIVLRQ